MKLATTLRTLLVTSLIAFSVASHANSIKQTTGGTLGLTLLPTLSTLLMSDDSAIVNKKEQLQALKSDAQDLLAEGVVSEALEQAISSLRESDESLSTLSDEEIAAAIVAALE